MSLQVVIIVPILQIGALRSRKGQSVWVNRIQPVLYVADTEVKTWSLPNKYLGLEGKALTRGNSGHICGDQHW